jgi:poly-gamma-glutamate synthesis protein (capsule biosynthesis protein)
MSKKLLPVLLSLLFIALGLSSCQYRTNLQPPNQTRNTTTPPQQESLRNHDNAEQHNAEQHRDDSDAVRLMFVGDVMMAGKVAETMEKKGNDYPLSEFLPVLKQADLVIANLETSVGTSGRLMEKKYAFQTSPDRFQLFEPLKGKILFTLANNHGMDGPLEETMHTLDRLGYPYVGVGRNLEQAFQPYVNEINGISFAVIGASRVIPASDWVAGENRPGMASAYVDEPLLGTIKQWDSKVDYVIIYVHWGKEHTETSNEIQLKLEEKLVSAGADLIIGSHPHVLQELKWKEPQQLTAFSLGNFVFTTSTHEIANETIILDVRLAPDHIAGVKVWPGKIHFGLIRHLQENNTERKRILERLDRLSPTIRINEDGLVTPAH